MEAFKIFLQQFPHFSPEIFEDLLPHLSVKTLEAGEYFLPMGTVCRQIGFIQQGLLRLYYLHDGKEISNCFCKEHTLTTSYRSLISQQASDIAIQAIEPSALIVFTYDSLQRMYEKHPFWQQVGRLAVEQEYLTVDSHHRFLRDISATERYLQILEKEPELLQRIPLRYLATYLQIAPETLSRIRNKISRT